MRFMVIVKATKDSEAGVKPDEQLLKDMMKYNEELVKAGVMQAGEGLHPSSKGARVKFSGKNRTVIDGPFAETKELIAGFWLWNVKSREEAIEWVKRCPNPMPGDSEIEIRQVFESPELTDNPEILMGMRPLVDGEDVLFLGRDNFISWELLGAEVYAPIINHYDTEELPSLYRATPINAKFDWDIAVEPGNTTKASAMFTNGAVVSAQSKNQAAAQKWVTFLTSSDEMVQKRLETSWELPPVADEAKLASYLDAGKPANRKAVFTSLDATVLPPVIARQQEMQDAVNKELSSAAAGRKSVAAALTDAQKAVNALLK